MMPDDSLNFIIIRAQIDREMPLECFLEGNQRLRTRQPERLELVMDDIQQMLVVFCIDLYE